MRSGHFRPEGLPARGRRSITQTVAIVIAAAVALAACTSSSEAADTPEPETTVPVTVAPTTTARPFETTLGQVSQSTDQPDEVIVALLDEIVASSGNRIEVIDTQSGDRHALATAAPLAIGEDPSSGERFGAIDVGGDRRVVFETTTGDEFPRINLLTAAGERSDVGEGLHPAISPDGRMFAFLGPNGITVMWSADSLLDDGFEVAGSVTSMRFSPSGALLAIASEDEGRGGVTIVEVTPNGFAESWVLSQPTGRQYLLPAWLDDETLLLLDRAEATDQAGQLLTITASDATVVASQLLDDAIVDLDVAPGGVTALVVTAAGEIKWVGADTSGVLVDIYHIGARW